MQTLDRTGPEALTASRGAASPAGSWRQRVAAAWSSGAISTFLVVVGVTAFVVDQLRPDLLFNPNMDVGGDNAAHVVAVYYFVHHLLPNGQLTGWDPQWFGGFPLYVFYFPLPPLIVAVLTPIFSYAVAFKLVSVLGLALMPASAWLFGALSGFRRPVPALMCVGMLPFVFNTSYSIDGGNILSDMAGEFSFTLAVALALCFLGVFNFALRTGRLRWLAALLFVATLLSHVVPALFAAGAACLFALAATDLRAGGLRAARRRARAESGSEPTRGLHPRWQAFQERVPQPLLVLGSVGLVGGLVCAFWLMPFGMYLRYSSSMGYTRVEGFRVNFLPGSAEVAVQVLAVVGAGVAILRRDRFALVLSALAAGSIGAFFLLPSGLVYNARWLPFWFCTTALLAAYALGEGTRLLVAGRRHVDWHAVLVPLVAALATVAVVAGYVGLLPGDDSPVASEAPGWVAFNYAGYQGKPGWGQFEQLVKMLERVAKVHGCGRLDYEYSPNTSVYYGSTLVPMSFPLWTNGCIQSEEGVYYESSTSTYYHFLDQSELSLDPSNPVVGLPYQPLDVADGIRHLQLTGVKYFLASSPTVEQEAADDPALVAVGSSPESPQVVDRTASSAEPPADSAYSYVLYEIKDSPLVTPLRYQPVVEHLSKSQWKSTSIAWYQTEPDWPVPIVGGGPSSWAVGKAGSLVSPSRATPVPSTAVRDVQMSDDTVSFSVARLGTPVLVKVPYFPNWQASGARGPYETTPNLMVVVPTSHRVVLRYGTTAVDWTGRAFSLAGLLGLAGLVSVVPPPAGPWSPEPPPAPALGEVPAGGDPEEGAGERGEQGGKSPGPSAALSGPHGELDADVLGGQPGGLGPGAQLGPEPPWGQGPARGGDQS